MLLVNTLPKSIRLRGSHGDTLCVLCGKQWPWMSIGEHVELFLNITAAVAIGLLIV